MQKSFFDLTMDETIEEIQADVTTGQSKKSQEMNCTGAYKKWKT
jgi:origin recognition complex subunit 2